MLAVSVGDGAYLKYLSSGYVHTCTLWASVIKPLMQQVQHFSAECFTSWHDFWMVSPSTDACLLCPSRGGML